jgi:beta-glucosidase
MWSTAPVERLGIPSVGLTDGPNGARGPLFPGPDGVPAVCTPCGTALAATWDPDLVERVGAMLGDEALTKASRVLLAPTVNIHRSPLAGRNFECLSEDPLLAGKIAAAYVRGVQSHGVVATVKHFAGNEAEFQRTTINSLIDERSLREIYLLPFELAVREGGALGIMTAYNRVNGSYCPDDAELLMDILRTEWGFSGFVVTDWFALASTVAAARAGLDLEMPGPGRSFGPALAEAVRRGDVDEAAVDEKARRLVSVFDRIGALDDPPGRELHAVDLPEHRALAREAAAASMVLLKNEALLPFDVSTIRSLAVIGPNADRAEIMGGGSAQLQPHYRTTPLEAIRARLGDRVEIRHEPGCDTTRATPALAGPQLTDPDGAPGMAVELFGGLEMQGPVLARTRASETNLMYLGAPAPEVPEGAFSLRARSRFTPQEDGPQIFTLSQAGRARLLLDGEVLLDGTIDPPPPGQLMELLSQEVQAPVDLARGRPVELVIEYSSRDAGAIRGVKIGGRRPTPPDLMDRAVAVAAAADAAVVVAGTSSEWESEGFDRTSMDLPGGQDELIARVLAANPRTVIVVNSGAPVTMDWAERARAVLQVWFGGQGMAQAIVDVLIGEAEPGGRLPTTFPVWLEHSPAYGNFPGENGQVRYGEGLLVGYRWYEARHLPTRFPFGHGLSYTTFEIGEPRLSSATFRPGDTLRLEVPVTNTGSRSGTEVIQCYVESLLPVLFRPPRELKAFAKVALDPGQTATATLELGDRAFACWDPGDPDGEALQDRLRESAPFMARGPAERPPEPGWRVDAGPYTLHVGHSSAEITHVVPVQVTESAKAR